MWFGVHVLGQPKLLHLATDAQSGPSTETPDVLTSHDARLPRQGFSRAPILSSLNPNLTHSEIVHCETFVGIRDDAPVHTPTHGQRPPRCLVLSYILSTNTLLRVSHVATRQSVFARQTCMPSGQLGFPVSEETRAWRPGNRPLDGSDILPLRGSFKFAPDNEAIHAGQDGALRRALPAGWEMAV